MTAKAQSTVQVEEQIPESGFREIGGFDIEETLDFEEPMPSQPSAPANDVVET